MNKFRSALLASTAALAMTCAPPMNNLVVAPPIIIGSETVNPKGETLGFIPDSIIYSDLARNNIKYLFSTITQRAGLEFAGCVYGRTSKSEKKVYVDEIGLAEVDYAFRDSTLFYCNSRKEKYLGDIHSHPMQNIDSLEKGLINKIPCWYSEKDLRRFYNNNKAVVGLVACADGVMTYAK